MGGRTTFNAPLQRRLGSAESIAGETQKQNVELLQAAKQMADRLNGAIHAADQLRSEKGKLTQLLTAAGDGTDMNETYASLVNDKDVELERLQQESA